MITRDARSILTALRSGELPADSPAFPKGVFMVEPVNFRLSADSASDNSYMNIASGVDQDRALEQYIGLVEKIRGVGIPVKNFAGSAHTPEDVFPNNVFATSPGRFIIGHMLHPSRQEETRRPDIRSYFRALGYQEFDLSVEDCVAELTGPLVIDRLRRLGFCGMSGRVDEAGLAAMHAAFNLRHTLYFDLVEGEYHTNVVMAVLAGRACLVHPESIADPKIVRALDAIYPDHILYLDDAEKQAFAGNCIALTHKDLFMSETAADALRRSSRGLLESWGFRLHSHPLDEIEKAGGSLRCMVAEIYQGASDA
ncbi:MAG: amidinotransferase [Xanthomonadales bacterium]|nr:amidinotransferase [Xanthomonadales bacterium]